jgi:hypothetical protein
MIKSRQKGFLVLEILIAGVILTASIAATMYMFRMGYDYIAKAEQSNIFSSKLVQAVGLLKTLDLEKKSGVEDMGNDVTLTWECRLLGAAKPARGRGEYLDASMHEIFLYRMEFSLTYRNTSKEYQINVFRYKSLLLPQSASH